MASLLSKPTPERNYVNGTRRIAALVPKSLGKAQTPARHPPQQQKKRGAVKRTRRFNPEDWE
jgi:hypothetical protein